MLELEQAFEKAFSQLQQYSLEIGVFTGKSARKVKVGVTNAELMFIHENGSPARNIPSRPVLQMTIDYANQNLLENTIDKCIELVLNDKSNEVEKELQKLALRIEKYARKMIYDKDSRLAPNSPRTIAAKGSDTPLLDTGQLARSITCRVVKS